MKELSLCAYPKAIHRCWLIHTDSVGCLAAVSTPSSWLNLVSPLRWPGMAVPVQSAIAWTSDVLRPSFDLRSLTHSVETRALHIFST